MKPSDLTVTDLFCGAGGSSQGAFAAGVRPLIALNHWSRAIETHNTNFPDAEHLCVDVMDMPTPRVAQLRSTHILVASPECTHHSQARTKKAIATLFDPRGADEAERSRATMMDVPRFAEQHGYEIVVVENVVEIVRWVGFEPWLGYMTNLGYKWRALSVNSLIAHPTPQSRDRIYFVFWRKGNRAPELDMAPPSWCPSCEAKVAGRQAWRRVGSRWGKYRQQYDYRCPVCAGIVYPYAYAASSAIDWALPTKRIGDRRRPLAEATRRRVEVGLERFGRPVVIQAAGHTWEAPGSGYARVWPADDPIPAQTATLSHGVATPAWMLSTARSSDPNHRPRPITDPAPTQTGQQEWALASAPFITPLRSGRPRASSIDDPLATVVADGSGQALVEPFLAILRGQSQTQTVRDPLSTVSAGGTHHALVTPAFLVKNYGNASKAEAMAHRVTEPMGTVTAVDHHSLVMPFLTSYYGQGGATSVEEPVPTVTTRDRHALVDPRMAVDDCGFRMLEPHEIQAAMAFGADYVVTGNKRERVRQLGNAVTPPVMQMILERCVETLG